PLARVPADTVQQRRDPLRHVQTPVRAPACSISELSLKTLSFLPSNSACPCPVHVHVERPLVRITSLPASRVRERQPLDVASGPPVRGARLIATGRASVPSAQTNTKVKAAVLA